MIVVIPSVTGDAIGVVWLGAVWALPVIGGEHDKGFGLRDEEARVGAAVEVFGHPSHVAVFAISDPLLEKMPMGGRGSGCDAAVVEPEAEGALANLGLKVIGHM